MAMPPFPPKNPMQQAPNPFQSIQSQMPGQPPIPQSPASQPPVAPMPSPMMQQPAPVVPTALPPPNSPNQLPAPQANPQQMAYKQALTSMAKAPKPLPIALSTTPEESPVVDGDDNVSEIVPKTEQDAVEVVEDEDSRDNTQNPNRANNPSSTMNYP